MSHTFVVIYSNTVFTWQLWDGTSDDCTHLRVGQKFTPPPQITLITCHEYVWLISLHQFQFETVLSCSVSTLVCWIPRKARLFTCFCSSFHVSKNCRPQWGLQTNTAVCFLCVADLKPWDIWCDVSKFLYISESQVVSFLLSESTELSCVVIPRKLDRRLYLFVFIVSFLRTVGHSEFKEIQYISFLYVADLKSWDFYLLCVCHFFIHLRSKYFPK